jgi:hypothetical protein
MYWFNQAMTPASVALVFFDRDNNASSLGFSVAHETITPHCGDGYVDGAGEYGPAEHCDDNNNLELDDCPADCTFDP